MSGNTIDTLRINVIGTPAPQGSKRHVGGGRMIESSKKVAPWREAVAWAAKAAAQDYGKWDGAQVDCVQLMVVFRFHRPSGHMGSGKNAAQVKPSAPFRPAVKPDLSKLIRSTEDALTTAGIWRDDAVVVSCTASKMYVSHGEATGAELYVYWIDNHMPAKPKET